MEAHLLDWLALLARWIHVIAGIMWIGDSFLFMWLDRQLVPTARSGGDGQMVGEMWMVHSGGFYEVIKRKYLAKGEIPNALHWFKWESYSTWLSGMCLLVLVYYFGGAVYLIDPTSAPLSKTAAVAVGIGSLVMAWLVYDAIAMTRLSANKIAFAVLGFAAAVAIGFGFTRIFQGRAAFLHLGALLATIMAANVFFRIIPAQRALLAATHEGRSPDTSLGLRAKLRSTHNHFLTLPVLFMMLSNHFPSAYGHPQSWLVIALLIAGAAAVKQVMITRRSSHPAVIGAAAVSLIAVAVMTAPMSVAGPAQTGGAPVAFSIVRHVIDTRCVGCHAQNPTTGGFVAPPSGVVFESNDAVKAYAERIKIRAVLTKTMPLGNLTAITDEERELLGRWVDQGAKVE